MLAARSALLYTGMPCVRTQTGTAFERYLACSDSQEFGTMFPALPVLGCLPSAVLPLTGPSFSNSEQVTQAASVACSIQTASNALL